MIIVIVIEMIGIYIHVTVLSTDIAIVVVMVCVIVTVIICCILYNACMCKPSIPPNASYQDLHEESNGDNSCSRK